MERNKTIRSAFAVAIAAILLGGGIGITTAVVAAPSPGPGQQPAPGANPAAPGQQKPKYHKNANGQTFGSELDATTPADLPDLVRAYAESGKIGYVYARDLHPEFFDSGPSSPEQALANQAAEPKTRVITVYAEDGTTKIGVFVIHKLDA